MKDKKKIREDIERLQANINECLDDLTIARDRKDDGEELIALRRMEALLGDVKQTCTSILNVMQEEPVSEDLDKEMDNYLLTVFSKDMDGGKPRFTTWFKALQKTAIHFAQWQKEQFEKNRLKHCNSITNEQAELEQGFIDQHLDKYNRMPTFIDAIEYGMSLHKEQMMAKAIDVKINRDTLYDLKPFIHEKYLDYKIGDKCKMILIKEG